MQGLCVPQNITLIYSNNLKKSHKHFFEFELLKEIYTYCLSTFCLYYLL